MLKNKHRGITPVYDIVPRTLCIVSGARGVIVSIIASIIAYVHKDVHGAGSSIRVN